MWPACCIHDIHGQGSGSRWWWCWEKLEVKTKLKTICIGQNIYLYNSYLSTVYIQIFCNVPEYLSTRISIVDVFEMPYYLYIRLHRHLSTQNGFSHIGELSAQVRSVRPHRPAKTRSWWKLRRLMCWKLFYILKWWCLSLAQELHSSLVTSKGHHEKKPQWSRRLELDVGSWGAMSNIQHPNWWFQIVNCNHQLWMLE